MIQNEDTNEEEIEDLTTEEEIRDFTDSIKIDKMFNYPFIISPTITSGKLEGGTITGGTITGGTIQTADTGRRVSMSGSNNLFQLYNSDSDVILKMNYYEVGGYIIQSIYPDDFLTTGLYISDSETTDYENNLINLAIQNPAGTNPNYPNGIKINYALGGVGSSIDMNQSGGYGLYAHGTTPSPLIRLNKSSSDSEFPVIQITASDVYGSIHTDKFIQIENNDLNTPVKTSTTTSTSASKLIDSNATFYPWDIGRKIENTTDSTTSYITARDSATQVSLNDDIFPDIGDGWEMSGTIKDTIRIGAQDLSAGNTMLALETEGTPIGSGTPIANKTIAISVNGTTYYLVASTSSS